MFFLRLYLCPFDRFYFDEFDFLCCMLVYLVFVLTVFKSYNAKTYLIVFISQRIPTRPLPCCRLLNFHYGIMGSALTKWTSLLKIKLHNCGDPVGGSGRRSGGAWPTLFSRGLATEVLSIRLSVRPLVMIKFESAKTRISAPTHPCATGIGSVSGLVYLRTSKFFLMLRCP